MTSILMLFIYVCTNQGLEASPFLDDRERGWHWYEQQTSEIEEQTSEGEDQKTEHKKMKPKEVVTAYREELENKMAEAWIQPTPNNIKSYMDMQQDMTNRSKTFSEVWMQTVFMNPDLDHTIQHPVNQKARHIQLDMEKKNITSTISGLSKEYGLFFFFSNHCPACHGFAPIVKQFSEQYGWEVLAISVDGEPSDLFPKAIADNGLIEQWNVQRLPALFAVNPRTGHVIPIAYGMTSIDQMEVRIMALVRAEQ